MNLSAPDLFLLEEGFRWFGPGDPVPLSFIRQAGASAVFTSLHQIHYGEVWSREAIRERKEMIEAAGATGTSRGVVDELGRRHARRVRENDHRRVSRREMGALAR
jgi:D-mannonate dehydratase